MKDTESTDAAAVGQYKIGQVMYPGTPTPPTHPSSANHQRPPTRVAMAARPHPRRKFRPRTPCLPPPGPPPCIQTPPRPTKVTGFGPKDAPDRRDRSIRPASNNAGAASAHTRPGNGGGGGADASGPAHPCASDGWPELVGASHPSSLPPHRTPPVSPHLGGERGSTRGHQHTPVHRQGEIPRAAANRQGSSPRSPSALPAVVQPP